MSLRDYLDPGGKTLAWRLEQLCTTLETLSSRLSSTIANTLGESLGGMVRDTALRVLGEVTQHLPASPPSSPRSYREHDDPMRDERNYWEDVEPETHYYAEEEDPPATAPAERLPTALATGLTAAAWWLRRWAGQSRLLTTLAVGLAATGAAYLGGPLVAVALHLAGAATQFSTLSQGIGGYDSSWDRYDRRP